MSLDSAPKILNKTFLNAKSKEFYRLLFYFYHGILLTFSLVSCQAGWVGCQLELALTNLWWIDWWPTIATGRLRRSFGRCGQLHGRPQPAGIATRWYLLHDASIRNDLLARTCALCVLFLPKTFYIKHRSSLAFTDIEHAHCTVTSPNFLYTFDGRRWAITGPVSEKFMSKT